MPEPYKMLARVDDFEMTSVVMDKDEFVEFVRTFEGSVAGMTAEIVDTFIQAEHVPLIIKGTKTKQFFDRYDVSTEYMTVIVRGAGPKVMGQLLGVHPTLLAPPGTN